VVQRVKCPQNITNLFTNIKIHVTIADGINFITVRVRSNAERNNLGQGINKIYYYIKIDYIILMIKLINQYLFIENRPADYIIRQ
jgi:hypothetical protein